MRTKTIPTDLSVVLLTLGKLCSTSVYFFWGAGVLGAIEGIDHLTHLIVPLTAWMLVLTLCSLASNLVFFAHTSLCL